MLTLYEQRVLHGKQNFMQDFHYSDGDSLLHLATRHHPIYTDPTLQKLHAGKRLLTQIKLLHYGCNVNDQDNNARTALYDAITNNDNAGCRLFLQAGADTKLKTNATGDTALHAAAYYGNISAIKMLKNAGADITATDNAGYTAMHHAVRSENATTALFETLVFLGVDINQTNKAGQTPLSLYREFTHYNNRPLRVTLEKLGAEE